MRKVLRFIYRLLGQQIKHAGMFNYSISCMYQWKSPNTAFQTASQAGGNPARLGDSGDDLADPYIADDEVPSSGAGTSSASGAGTNSASGAGTNSASGAGTNMAMQLGPTVPMQLGPTVPVQLGPTVPMQLGPTVPMQLGPTVPVQLGPEPVRSR